MVADAMHALYRLGGEVPHVAAPFVASGEHMSPPNRFATDKIIRNGDLVFIDIGAAFNGHFADLGPRHLRPTKPTSARDLHGRVLRAHCRNQGDESRELER